ncbi:N-acetyl sugar amidotransferase [Sphingomonas sp. Leaf21]|uniref:N-acetyl sugar amidotransferase n=1 Tax=Sphingomonas sp. Leaf21 TaxID=2876550 RepID=UPI001E643FAC|nr:N-acetyl sugar amidotransferase [Sphingomonas sp. Leaf21]
MADNQELEAFFGLSPKVQFCRSCVISNQRPSSTVEFKHSKSDQKKTIGFGDDGICDACRYHQVKAQGIDWKHREDQLVATLDKFRRNDGSYDMVVPGSGGKDSAYTSHVLKYRYGMNPLTVTWAPHLYTDIGWQNFTNWIHEGGHDNLLFTPNGRLHRLLTKLAFENLLHPFQPFIVGQRIIGPSIALKYGVQLVMYGENQAEYGNDPNENYKPTMDRKFFSAQDPLEMMLGGVSIGNIIKDYDYKLNDFAPYIPPTAESLEEAGVEVHYLGFYLPWDPQECYYYAVEHTGFQANPERTPGTYSKYSSIDDKIDMFHYFTTLIKFGIGRATYDAAQEVRNGKITRQEAVHLVRKYDQEFPSRYYPEFLEYIGLTDAQFWETVDSFRSPHLWKKSGNGWELRETVS